LVVFIEFDTYFLETVAPPLTLAGRHKLNLTGYFIYNTKK